MDHLTADLAGITRISRSLRVLGDEFAAITQVADASSAAGSAELASALTEFATGWSNKRDALIGELRQMSQLAAEAVREYTSTDDTLARALPGTSPVTGPVAGPVAGPGVGPGVGSAAGTGAGTAAGTAAGTGANGARP